MRVFLSWSGPWSRQLTEVLNDWLPKAMMVIHPFFSEEDIASGQRWSEELARQLRRCDFGILVLTPENVTSPWLMFEAGALSKNFGKAHVCPLLFRLRCCDIPEPLRQFQAVIFSKKGIHKLLSTINALVPRGRLSDRALDEVVDTWWPKLESKIPPIPLTPHPTAKPPRVIETTSWEAVIKRIPLARRRVDVLQTWLPWIRTEREYWQLALKHPRVSLRILLIDQRIATLRTAYRESTDGYLVPTVREINRLASKFNVQAKPRIEGRFYMCIPFGPVYLIDDDVFWGMYYAHRDSLFGPALQTRRDTEIGRLITESYERVWSRSIPVSGALRLPSRTIPRGASDSHMLGQVRSVVHRFRGRLTRVEMDSSDLSSLPGGLLVVIRHAETDLNAAGIFSGDLDVGINKAGHLAARRARKKLSGIKWDWTYCSTLQRSRDTLIEVLGEGESYEILDRDEFNERRMGDVVGLFKKSYRKSRKKYCGKDLVYDAGIRPDGGESHIDVLFRLTIILDQIVDQVERGERVLICTHEGPIRMLRLALEGLDLARAVREDIGNLSMFAYAVKVTNRAARVPRRHRPSHMIPPVVKR